MQPFSAEERALITRGHHRRRADDEHKVSWVVPDPSGGYLPYALLWAALAARGGWPLIYLTNWPIEHIYLAQLAAFAVSRVVRGTPCAWLCVRQGVDAQHGTIKRRPSSSWRKASTPPRAPPAS